MKLSAVILALVAATATAGKLSPEATRKLLRNARRLDEAEGDDAAEDENAFVAQYHLKFVSCDNKYSLTNENGETTYGAAVLRLCPTDYTMSDGDCSQAYGCKKGYGDFVVSIEDYVDAFFEDQADNMGWDDDKFDLNRFARCGEYEAEQNGDDDTYANAQFFVGPTCNDEGDDIGLGIFSDQYCTQKSETSFYQVSNGWNLPYSDGGLASTECVDCLEYNEEDGAYDVRDMCIELYDESTVKCETEMEYMNYQAKDEYGCEDINALLPRAARKSKGTLVHVFGSIILVLMCIGFYAFWWRNKKKKSFKNRIILS